MALRCSIDMTQSTLVETCHHNLQTTLLSQIEVAQSLIWKQLVLQGKGAEDIVAKVNYEIARACSIKSIRQQGDPTPMAVMFNDYL